MQDYVHWSMDHGRVRASAPLFWQHSINLPIILPRLAFVYRDIIIILVANCSASLIHNWTWIKMINSHKSLVPVFDTFQGLFEKKLASCVSRKLHARERSYLADSRKLSVAKITCFTVLYIHIAGQIPCRGAVMFINDCYDSCIM